jgi:hypothetical protein
MSNTTTSTINFPFAPATVLRPTFAATLAVTITSNFTILDPTILTGAMTINLTIDSEVLIGSTLLVQTTTTATEVTTFGTGFTAPTLTGVAGKTFQTLFIYDGITFKPVATPRQID